MAGPRLMGRRTRSLALLSIVSHLLPLRRGDAVRRTQRCHGVFMMILKVISSSGRLVVELDVDHMMCLLISDIDHTNHIES